MIYYKFLVFINDIYNINEQRNLFFKPIPNSKVFLYYLLKRKIILL